MLFCLSKNYLQKYHVGYVSLQTDLAQHSVRTSEVFDAPDAQLLTLRNNLPAL